MLYPENAFIFEALNISCNMLLNVTNIKRSHFVDQISSAQTNIINIKETDTERVL